MSLFQVHAELPAKKLLDKPDLEVSLHLIWFCDVFVVCRFLLQLEGPGWLPPSPSTSDISVPACGSSGSFTGFNTRFCRCNRWPWVVSCLIQGSARIAAWSFLQSPPIGKWVYLQFQAFIVHYCCLDMQNHHTVLKCFLWQMGHQ